FYLLRKASSNPVVHYLLIPVPPNMPVHSHRRLGFQTEENNWAYVGNNWGMDFARHQYRPVVRLHLSIGFRHNQFGCFLFFQIDTQGLYLKKFYRLNSKNG